MLDKTNDNLIVWFHLEMRNQCVGIYMFQQLFTSKHTFYSQDNLYQDLILLNRYVNEYIVFKTHLILLYSKFLLLIQTK